jgi:peptidoglycan/LPS O-acetylase OafA/YrhL
MTRRLEVGPALVALGAAVVLVSLFLEWYGHATAWEAFELTDVLIAAFAVGALVTAASLLSPDRDGPDRGRLPWLVGATLVIVAAEILSPPPAVGGEDATTGAWLAIAGALVMAIGTVLSYGRVSLSVAVEERRAPRRVAAVDHRPPPTETGAQPIVPTEQTPPPDGPGVAGR